jgi:hypothetical protein
MVVVVAGVVAVVVVVMVMVMAVVVAVVLVVAVVVALKKWSRGGERERGRPRRLDKIKPSY